MAADGFEWHDVDYFWMKRVMIRELECETARPWSSGEFDQTVWEKMEHWNI
jgi:hypothetical protein